MARVDLHLSEELERFVRDQVQAGEFDDDDAYIQTLIARAKTGKEKLESLLIEGLDSGAPLALDPDEWKAIRADVNQRLSNGQ